jgi:hypothetical protein
MSRKAGEEINLVHLKKGGHFGYLRRAKIQ